MRGNIQARCMYTGFEHPTYKTDAKILEYVKNMKWQEPGYAHTGRHVKNATGRVGHEGCVDVGYIGFIMFRHGGTKRNDQVLQGLTEELPIVTVDIKDTVPTQHMIRLRSLLWVLTPPIERSEDDTFSQYDPYEDRPVIGVRYEGKVYIVDGHHRWFINMMRSTVTHINLRLIDFDNDIEATEEDNWFEGQYTTIKHKA